ncbi:DUF6607 family protein [Haloferula helveola]
MKIQSILAAATLPALAGSPPAEDREAILAMAGTHAVHFHFEETVAIATGYTVKPDSYDENATEIVTVVEDTTERITLQHLLVVRPKDKDPMVIKHWAQIWTWEDTEILDYCGEDQMHEWQCVRLTPGQAAGTWSQLVTQTDDTPRYEGYGKWIHENGESYWESSPTRRPLPRREYTKREDYDHLLVTNRHSLTATGWVHHQDNRKIVDRGDGPATTLCHESGLNTYNRTESELATVALDWWKEHGPFWDGVRNFWLEAGETAPATFSYSTFKDGEALSKRIAQLESDAADAATVRAALTPYVTAE